MPADGLVVPIAGVLAISKRQKQETLKKIEGDDLSFNQFKPARRNQTRDFECNDILNYSGYKSFAEKMEIMETVAMALCTWVVRNSKAKTS